MPEGITRVRHFHLIVSFKLHCFDNTGLEEKFNPLFVLSIPKEQGDQSHHYEKLPWVKKEVKFSDEFSQATSNEH